MELIDTHCHLTFEPLDADVDAVVERSRQAGVTGWVTVGTSLADSHAAVELAGRYERMVAAVGIHPHDAKDADDTALAELERIAQHPKVVAIGETGLDYHYNFSEHSDQRRVFAAHLEIAKRLDLPVVIHSRNAFDGLKGVVFHCYGGTADQAERLLAKGYFISFTGVVTFKNAAQARDAAQVVPLDRLMVETDCPYMSPEPVRSQKPNEPALMVHTAFFLADLKRVDLNEFAHVTTQNAMRFFGLSD